MKECGFDCVPDDMEQMFYGMSSAEKMKTISLMKLLLSEKDAVVV